MMDVRQHLKSIWRFAFLLGVVLACNQKCKAAENPPALTDEQIKAFTWFSTLGFPDAKGSPLVRVATGHWSQGAGAPENSYDDGVLLEDKGEGFTIFTFDLRTETFRKTPKNTPEHQRVGYEKIDLAKWAADYLKWLHEADAKKDDLMRHANRTLARKRLSERAEIFVIAWVCWRNDLDKEAGQLYKEAAALQAGRPADPWFRRGLAIDIGHSQIWQAFLDFGDPSVSRPQLLERFERIVRNYPESEYLQLAQDAIALLKPMIQEDDEHARKRTAGKPFEQLSKNEQIEELIFQLRDQNGKQQSQPGRCDVFAKEYDPVARRWVSKDTPAHRLVKMGYDAVPQLIAVLEDKRLTRSVGFHRDFHFSHYVLRVGDCAEQILAQITGRSFYVRRSTSGAMVKDGKAAGVKAAYQAWYDDLKEKGEQRILIDATEKGGESGVAQAKMLLERYPEVAPAAIITGAKAALDDRVRTEFVTMAGKIKGDAPLPFLLAEVKDGPCLGSRLAAATALHKRGRAEGVTAMIAEWQNPRSAPARDGILGHSHLDQSALIRFLASCGKVDAVAALAKDLRKRPVDQRMYIVFGLGFNVSKAVRALVEEVMVAELEDSDERIGMGGTLDDKVLNDPRIADIAAHMLYRMDRQKYPFDLSASLAQRDRSIVVLKNAWRKEYGLAAIPLPAARVISAVADDKLQPLVDKFLNSSDPERAQWQTQIEQLGLGALPGLTRSLEKISNEENPRRVALEQLSQRLACVVAEVVVAADSVKPEADLARRLDAMKGKPFDPSVFYELVDSVSKKLPKEVAAIQLSANRAEDGTGFVLKADLLDATRAAPLRRSDTAPNEPPSYTFSDRVAVGKKTLHSISGSIGTWLTIDMAPLQEALRGASRAPANQSIEVRIQIVAEGVK